jgi:hypothetical protein
MGSIDARLAQKNIVGVQKNPRPPTPARGDPDRLVAQALGPATKDIVQEEDEILQVHRPTEILAHSDFDGGRPLPLGEGNQAWAVDGYARELDRPIGQRPARKSQGLGETLGPGRRWDHIEVPIGNKDSGDPGRSRPREALRWQSRE